MKKILLLFVAMMTVLGVTAKTSDESNVNLIGSFEPADGDYEGVVVGAPKVMQLTLVNKGTTTVAAHDINLYVENPQDDDDYFYIGSGTYSCPAIAPGDTVKAQWTVTFPKAGTYYLSAYDNLTEDSYESDYFTVSEPAEKNHADTTIIIRPVDKIWGAVVNEDKQMEVIIKNTGVGYNINLNSFLVGWDWNEDYTVGGYTNYFAGGTLTPGDSVKYTFTYTPTKTGTYYFYVYDYYTFDIGVIDRFHVYANDQELQAAIDAGKADGPDEGDTYDVDGYVTPANNSYGDIKVGSPKEFSLVVFNNGEKELPSHLVYPEATCSYDYDEYQTLPSFTVPAIPAGDSVVVNFTYTPTTADSYYINAYDNLTKGSYQSYTFNVADTFDVIVADTTFTLVPEDGFAGAVNGQEKSFLLTVKNSGIHKLIKSFTVNVGIGMLNDEDAYAYAPAFYTGKIEAGDSVTKRITITPTWGEGDAEIWIYVQKTSGSHSFTVYPSFKIYASQEDYDKAVAAGVKGVSVKGQTEDVWHTLSGARLSGKPAQPGLYINGNRKVVVK